MTMKSVLSGLLAAVIMALIVFGLWQYEQAKDVQAMTPQVVAVEQQAEPTEWVIQLPEDGQAYHTSVIVHADWQRRSRERELIAWFDAEPRLRSLKAQTHFHVYPVTDPVYQSNLASAVTTVPSVIVQSQDGKVVYKAAEGSPESPLPSDPEKLGGKLGKLFKALRPCPGPGPCPNPNPTPNPSPNPNPQPIVPVLPDMDVDHRDRDKVGDEPPLGFAVGIAAVAFVLVAGIAGVVEFVKRVKG